MGWFKDKEKVPEVPISPALPDLSKQPHETDIPDIPSFNKTPQVNSHDISEIKPLDTNTLTFKTGEKEKVGPNKLPKLKAPQRMPDKGQLIPLRHSENLIPKPPKIEITKEPLHRVEVESKPQKVPNQKEPIFVRVDKFQLAQKNIREIKDKIEEIESTLVELREVRTKEDGEFSKWEEEITKLKSKLMSVDSEIFSQI